MENLRRAELGQYGSSYGVAVVSGLGGCHPSNARTRPALPRTRRQSSPSEKAWELPVSTTSCGFTDGHTILEEQCAVAVHDEIGQSLERLFLGLTEDSMTHATLSAGQSGIGFGRARDIAAPAHLGALIAAKPRIQGMIRNAVRAALLPEQMLEARLSEVIETPTSTYLSTLDSDAQATAKLYVQNAAQAADEAWQQTFAGLQGLGVANPTMSDLEHPTSASQDEDSDVDFSATPKSRHSAPQLQAQLSRPTDRTRLRRLKNALLSRGAWQQVTRIEDLCHAQVSHEWLYHVDAFAGSVLTPYDYITDVQKRLGNRIWVGGGQCRCYSSFLDPQLEHAETCSKAEATRGHHACDRAVVCGMKLADPGITTEPRGLTASQSRPADILTSAAVPGRSVAPDVCVASSIAAAARGDAAQAAFDRKLSHYRKEIGELNRVFTAARLCGRAAASSRHSNASVRGSSPNGQHLSAKSLHRRWKHEIQIALLRRRAAMPRAFLPNPSVRAEWLFAGIINRALHHWGHVPALDGGRTTQFARLGSPMQ